MRSQLILAALLIGGGPAISQPFVRQVEPFSVFAGGSQIALPFAGGINSPLHQFVDIDNDGDYDLIIFDNDLSVDFYRNEGTSQNPRLTHRSELLTLPAFSVWFRFVDFDGDGKQDLCTEDTTFQGLRVYKNTGTTSSPQFAEIVSTLKDTAGVDVYTGGNSIPVFVDIDADGAYDLFSANISGTVNFYRNVGTATLPRYAFVSGTWENILIFGDTCTTSLASARTPLHGAAAYSFGDIDGDADQDMFIGDLFSAGVFSLRNIGTPQFPHLQCATSHFPENEPLITGGFNQTSFVDIDGDGDLDMFAGTLAGIVQRDGFIFYRNTGTATVPQFQRVTNNFISTIDVGMNATVAFCDVDGDSDQDMFVGNLLGELAIFRNTGTPELGSFVLEDSTYLSVANGFSFAPAFTDIDGDGDYDLLAGMFDGTMKFFRNDGTPQGPQFLLMPFVTDSIDAGFNATPAFADIDGDGDKDLFVGSKSGTIRFYRNSGDATSFSLQLVTPVFLGINLGEDNYVTPVFSDYDGDGDIDFFYGSASGTVTYYENTGTSTNPEFVHRSDAFATTAPTRESAPAFVDIDHDGDQDLFLGIRKGGVLFYRNERLSTGVEEEFLPKSTALFQNYPNPFNSTTTLRFAIADPSFVSLRVYDILGRESATLVHQQLERGTYTSRWEATQFPSGVYFFALTTADGTMTKKMIIVR